MHSRVIRSSDRKRNLPEGFYMKALFPGRISPREARNPCRRNIGDGQRGPSATANSSATSPLPNHRRPSAFCHSQLAVHIGAHDPVDKPLPHVRRPSLEFQRPQKSSTPTVGGGNANHLPSASRTNTQDVHHRLEDGPRLCGAFNALATMNRVLPNGVLLRLGIQYFQS